MRGEDERKDEIKKKGGARRKKRDQSKDEVKGNTGLWNLFSFEEAGDHKSAGR